MRIWFNRGFSLAPIAAAMRAADPTLDVCISIGANGPRHAGPSATWIDGGDSDPADAAAYLDWVRATIVSENIDLLIPTRRRKAIAAAAMPCAVHLPASIKTLDLLDDKLAFAAAVEGEAWHLPTVLVASADELAAQLAHWPAEGPRPCIKPRKGVNGLGFWRLTDTRPTRHLNDPDKRAIRADLYLAALREQELLGPIDELVVMPYLPGPEVSFDMLCHHGVLLKYAARTKLSNGHQHITSHHALEAAVDALANRFMLHGLVNCQFRRADDDSWKLLEINGRPAGGVVYAEQVGCNLIGDWGGLLSGRLMPHQIERRTIDTEVSFTSVARPLAA